MGRGRRKCLSSGAVILRDLGHEYHLLMLRSYSIWDFPKGLVEVGEDPLHTALREVREETTLDDLHFPWGHVFIETGPYGRGKIARYYLAKTHRENVAILPNPETGIPEHAEYRWFSPRDALRIAGPRVRLVVDWALGQVHK